MIDDRVSWWIVCQYAATIVVMFVSFWLFFAAAGGSFGERESISAKRGEIQTVRAWTPPAGWR